MKQFFALSAGFSLHLVDDLFETLGSKLSFTRRFVLKDFYREAGEDRVGIRPGEDFGVVGIPKCRRRIIPEDEARSIRQFVQPTDRANEQIRDLREPEPKSGSVSGRLPQQPGPREKGTDRFAYSFGWAFFDVVPVQPVQLLHVEDCRRWRDSLEREFLDQLLDR